MAVNIYFLVHFQMSKTSNLLSLKVEKKFLCIFRLNLAKFNELGGGVNLSLIFQSNCSLIPSSPNENISFLVFKNMWIIESSWKMAKQ